MAIRRLSSASAITGAKSSKVWDQTTFQSGMFAIATVTVPSGGTSSISFSSIPDTYTHLQIRAITRDTAGAAGVGWRAVRFNGDSGANYMFHVAYGTGSGVGAYGAGTNQTSMVYPQVTAGYTANAFGVFIMDILNYASTSKNKTIKVIGGGNNNDSGSDELDLMSGCWRNNTTAVNSITFTGTSGFAENTSYALYGIKAS